ARARLPPLHTLGPLPVQLPPGPGDDRAVAGRHRGAGPEPGAGGGTRGRVTTAVVTEPAAPRTPFTDRRVAAGLVVLVAVVAVPFAVLGPKFILDDWFTVYWRTFQGVLWTGGHGQLRARPGAWLTFLVEFGLVGRHPLAVF